MAVEELLPPASAKPAQDISSAFRDPILIAALPAAAYWFAFKYETGYLGAYGLPPYLAEVSLQSTMLWLLAVLTIAFTWFVLVNVLMMLWPEKLSIRRKLAPFGMLALFVLWQLFAFGTLEN